MITRALSSDEMDADQSAVWSVVTDLYAAYLDGDRIRLESHLASGATLWDSARADLRTKEDMVAARVNGESAPGGDQPHTLAAEPLVITVVGDLAVEAHTLEALFDDESLNQSLRCTSALSRADGRWIFVHHHEELLAGD